jgi:translation initiation factor 4G
MLSASRGHLKRGFWDLLIVDEAARFDYLERLAVAEPLSLCHYESFWLAELDGQPAAALSGFDRRGGGWTTAGQAMSKVQSDVGWTDTDLAASQQRVAPVWACFLQDIGADWGIENVATRLEFRRRGLAGTLMDRVLQEGRDRETRLAAITTMIGNDAAVSVYEKSGFRISDEKRCPDFEAVLGAPGFVRLTRDL